MMLLPALGVPGESRGACAAWVVACCLCCLSAPEPLSSSSYSPGLFALPDGLRPWNSWLDVVEWFYNSKGDALAALLSDAGLTEAASGVAVSPSAAVQTPLLQLLPRCTPAAAAAGYAARVLSCQRTYWGLFLPTGGPGTESTPEATAAETAAASPGPVGVALLLLQEVGESHLKETPYLLHAVANFALPVATRRLLEGPEDPPGESRCIAEAARAALSSLVSDCRRLIQERMETSIPANLIGRLCCVVLHPLMLRAEWRIASILTPLSGPSDGEGETGDTETAATQENVCFAFEFARDLLVEGTTSLALSRAVVCKR